MDLTDKTTESGPDTGNAGSSKDSGVSLDDAISKAIAGGEEEKIESPAHGNEGAQDKQPAEDAGRSEPAKDGKEAEAAPAGDAEATEAPKHWPEERRQAFAGLPKEAQSIVKGFVKDLQGGFTRKSQELSDKARFAESVSSLFSDSDRAEMQQHGASDLQAVGTLVKLNQFAKSRPAEYIKWAMQHFGVGADQLGLSRGTEQQKPSDDADTQALEDLLTDPNVKLLKSELDQIKARIADRDAQDFAAEQQRRQGSVNALRNAVGTFRTQLDDTGQLQFPHFDQVSRAMGALMETHPKLSQLPDSYEKMEKAYRMAVMADPELADPVIESEVSRRLTARQKQDEAERAKRAGGIRTPLGAPASRPKPASLDDAIAAAMSQAGV
mgnify:FL=1